MPRSCYNYSPIILTATVDLLPFAAILHNKNNACDIFTTGKLPKEINALLIRKASLHAGSGDLSTHRGARDRGGTSHAGALPATQALPTLPRIAAMGCKKALTPHKST